MIKILIYTKKPILFKMKYIKSYIAYESLSVSYALDVSYDISDLEIDDNDIETYFKDKFKITEYDYENVSTESLISCVNKDDYMYNAKEDEKNITTIDDINDIEIYARYIRNNLSDNIDDVNTSLIEFGLDINDDYLENILELPLSELKKLIDFDEDLIEFFVDDKFKKNTLLDYITQSGNDNYEYLKNFIDYKKLDNLILDDKSDDYKKNFYINNQIDDDNIIRNIMEYNTTNIIILFDVFDETSIIAKEFDYQDAYINEIKKENHKKYFSEIQWEKEELPNILYKIHNKYSLNTDIENKYIEYTYKVAEINFNV